MPILFFQIVKPGPPETPKNLEVTAVDGASISLAWLPGFNGGHNQSFDIQVFDETTGQRVLKLRNIRRVEGNRTVIQGLTPQTRYAMKIRAWNRDGYSNFSEEVIIKTRRKLSYDDILFTTVCRIHNNGSQKQLPSTNKNVLKIATDGAAVQINLKLI